MGFCDIIAETISNSHRESPRNIPLRIFTTANLFLPSASSTLQVFMFFLINLLTSSDILYILRQAII